MKIGRYTPAQLKKVFVGIVGFLLTLIAALMAGNLIPVDILPWVVVFIGVCYNYGIFAVKNAPVDEPDHVV